MPAPAPASLDKIPAGTLRDRQRPVWTSPDSLATTLITLFLDQYGTEGLEWDPGTLRDVIADDYSLTYGKDWPILNLDRLLAGIAILSTDSFFCAAPDFIAIANVLFGVPFDPTVFDPADGMECAWAITEGLLLNPEPPGRPRGQPFGDEVVDYIRQVVQYEGLFQPPGILMLVPDMAPSNYPSSDDPGLFTAVQEMAIQKAQDIREEVKARLTLLASQLEALPLAVGQTHDALERIGRVLSTS